MLGGSAESRMSLADTVSGGQLVSELVVMVLQSKGSTIGGISTPLTVSGMELSARLEGSSESRVRLADCVSGSQFMAVYVVSILQSHSSSNIGGVSTPLTNGVSMAAVTGGC